MSFRRPVVILTDDDPNLDHYVAMLRGDGWQVTRAADSLEAAMLTARGSGAVLIARAGLLPQDAKSYFASIRSVAGASRIVVSESPDHVLSDVEGTDARLAEPYGYGALLHALGDLHLEEAGSDRGIDPQAPETPGEGSDEVQSGLTDAGLLEELWELSLEFAELEHDREKLLTRGLAVVMEVTSAQRGSLMLQSGPGQPLKMVRRAGFPDELPTRVVVEVGNSIAGRVVEAHEPLLVRDFAKEFPGRPARGYRTNSCLIVPLRNRQTSLGVINLSERDGGEAFSPRDVLAAKLLASHLAVALRNAQNVSELHALTVIDPLTQLYNRRHFDRQLRNEIERARRYGRQLSLALLDIDNFKVFNDVNGYVTGDAILREVGRIIRRGFRDVDIVTRWGGDEFAILLPETGPPAVDSHGNRSYIDRVRKAIETFDFRVSSPELNDRITASVGVATFPSDCRDAEDLFRRANEALHHAKQSGANRTVLASEVGNPGAEAENE